MTTGRKTRSTLIKNINADVPLELYNAVAQAAVDEERTIAQQLRFILRHWYEQQEG